MTSSHKPAGIAAMLTLLMMTAASEAGCVYGNKNLSGSLGAGQSDGSRSFTISRSDDKIIQLFGV